MSRLNEIAKNLLESGKVNLIIGYEKMPELARTKPVFIKRPQDVEKLVFNPYCLNNLAVYLTRKEFRNAGKIGITAKGCDVRSILQLINENQLQRENVYIIGLECAGVYADFPIAQETPDMASKCFLCQTNTPPVSDEMIPLQEKMQPKGADQVAEKIAWLDKLTSDERWNFWVEQFDKCIRCYACRQACPLCFCERCLVDKTTPRWIESTPSKRANFAWNMFRAFHLSGRCIGCGECERVCPMDIPLSVLNRYMSEITKREFEYASGMSISDTLIGHYSLEDNEEFIR